MDNHPGTDLARPIARQMAEWAAAVRLEDLPEDVVRQLKLATRDGFGCGLFGSRLEWAERALKGYRAQGCGEGSASVWGTDAKLVPADAALVNGVAVSGYELDDGNVAGSLHGTSALLPALMAIAEHRAPISGADFLPAMAIGHEIGIRVSQSMGLLIKHGWHSPTMFGTIAAAAAVARALRLDAEQMAHAITLGALQVSGLTVSRVSGMGKRLYAGRAAQAGLSMALLAEAGYTGPADVFEHPGDGLCVTYNGTRPFDLSKMTQPFGDYYGTRHVYFKIYASCGGTHSSIDGVRSLCEEHPEIKPESVDRMATFVSAQAMNHVGRLYQPKDVPAAQFSLQYTMAAALLEGNVYLDQFRPELLAHPRILEVAKRIEVAHDPALDNNLETRNFCRVEIHLKDGRTFQKSIQASRGRPKNPASEAELFGKFENLARAAISESQARQLSDQIGTLETLDDVGSLTRLVRSR
jgi:aconitate decarboxylase